MSGYMQPILREPIPPPRRGGSPRGH